MPTVRFLRCAVVTVLTLALAPAGAAMTAAPAAQVSGTVTVRVELKKSWRVTKAKKVRVTGAQCTVQKLLRKKGKPASGAVLRCTIPDSVVGSTISITIRVKGGKGKIVKRLAVPADGTPGGGSPTTPPSPTPPIPTPTTPVPAPPTMSKGAVQRVNTNSTGQGGNSEAGSPTWSPDGTSIAFYSKATNLVPGVTDGCAHVYLKTLSTGAIRVVDTAQDGTLGDGCPPDPGINMGLSFSPNGQWLLFCSASTNLVADPWSGHADLFGKNLGTGEVEWFGYGCAWPAWSPDGTKIAFATDFEFNPACGYLNNGNYDVFWVDRNSTLATCADFHRVSSDSSGNQSTYAGPMDSERPVWSHDSTRILFASASRTLVDNDTNLAWDVFIKNIGSNQTTRVSTNSAGQQVSGGSDRATWSPDSTKVLFESRANDLVAGDVNAYEDIFIKDLTSQAVTLMSTNASGQQTVWPHKRPSWSPDGTRITWESDATNLVPSDINALPDVFTKSLSNGFVQLISSNASGAQGENWSSLVNTSPRAWSPDSTRVVFTSRSTNLAPNDNNSFQEDIFVKTL